MLTEFILKEFDLHHELLTSHLPESIKILKQTAFDSFVQQGMPHSKMENWRHTDISKLLKNNYQHFWKPETGNVDIEKLFQCELPEMDTYTVVQYNAWFLSRSSDLTTLDNGTIIGSLYKAMQMYPDIVEKHFGACTDFKNNALQALNTAFFADGIFVYVPDNVIVEKPIQIINIINSEQNAIVHPRNLFIAGKNSKLTIVHCDHSLNHRHSFINSLTEIYADENAHIDHYKMQNKDADSALFTTINAQLQANARLSTNTLILNGGLIRNNINVMLNGKGAEADLKGLYLVDRNQHVDNQIFVSHNAPNCYSNQLYKGIADDNARAVFNGRILVQKDAQKTIAYQANNNILLADTAQVNSQPQLEIYADDVKCSHGSTVGQLDPNAMFYLRSRGICEHSARMLLMYAFAAEVVDQIAIEALRNRLDNLVAKRLRGELSICDQCMLHCNEKAPAFLNMDFKPLV